MRADVRVDADGYHVFALDEKLHDPFTVMQRLWDAAHKAAGTQPTVDPERDAVFAKIMKERQSGR